MDMSFGKKEFAAGRRKQNAIRTIVNSRSDTLFTPSPTTLPNCTATTGRVFFFGVYSWLVKVLGQFSIIYFRGLGLRIGVRVWVRVRVGVRVWVRVRVRVGLGLVWCYGQGKFRVRVRIRVRVVFGLGL